MLRKYASNIHPRVEDLIIHYNKPLTVIHKASHNVPSFLMNKDQTIAIRLTQSDLLQEIINGLSRPIVSTSANRQGDSSPACFQEIKSDIIEKVDYVCQSDRVSAQPKAASQIIRYTTEGELIFLR